MKYRAHCNACSTLLSPRSDISLCGECFVLAAVEDGFSRAEAEKLYREEAFGTPRSGVRLRQRDRQRRRRS